ncbi:reverse transcriptase domain-containing protein [Tanacetum coccineum]
MPPRRNRRNNGADPAFAAAVEQAVVALLPTLTARIIDEIRQNENNGNNKKYEREYKSIHQLDGETSTEFMKRFLRLADKIMNTEFTDVAQVANVSRNIEVLCDRSGQEGNNKRNRYDHRIQPSESPAQVPDQIAYDRRDSDRYGNSDRHGNNDRRDRHDNIRQRSWRDHDQHDRGQQYGRSYGSSSQRGYSDYASSPPCNLCGKLHPGKACHKATNACFTCGQVWNLAKDCKKRSTSNDGNGNKKQPSTNGRVFALTTDQAAKASGTVLGTLSMYDYDAFVLFDTCVTHIVLSLSFSKHIKAPSTPLDFALSISTPMGNNVVLSHEFRSCLLRFDDKIRSTNLLPLEMSNFDIIFGMDWLTEHRAAIDSHTKRVIFGDLNNLEFIYHSSLHGVCMSTRSSTRNLIPPLENPEHTIRRTRVDPTPLNNFEEINMAANRAGNDGPPLEGGDGLPVPDLRTMEDIKVNGVIDDALRLYLFPHSLTHHATAWYDRLPKNSITTFEQMAKMFLGKYFPPSMVTKLRNEITNFCQRPDESLFKEWERYKLSIDRCPNHNMLPVTQIDTFYNGLTLRHRDTINAAVGGTFMKRRPEECYDLIENMTAHHNDWDTSAQRSESSSSITSSSDLKIVALKAEIAEINKNLMKMLQTNQQVKAVTPSCETCGGPHAYNDCPATVGQTQNVYAAGAYNQGGNSYQPQGNRNLLSYRSDNYLGPPGFNQNQNRSNQNQNYQNRNQGNNHNQGNNQGRNQFFQGASHVQNPPPAYQAPAHQAPGYQAPVHQAPIPQPQVVTTTEFTNYMKANDAILKNMQTNMTSLTNSNLELKNMFGQFMKMNTASSSGSGTLPSNTITNPREDLKGITTRSGVAYKGPTIPTTSSSPKVVERETEVTKDTVPPTNNGSTKDVQPPVVQVETQVPNSEPVVAPVVEPVEAPVSAPKPNPKPSIPYPSRLNDQKLREKANNQMEKIFQIFLDLHFDISFADALILMPKFASTIISLLSNKEKLFELARTLLNEHCSVVLLKKLLKKLGDPASFSSCAIFSEWINPTPTLDPIVSTSSPTLSPFGDSDFLLEETDSFLAIEDEPISLEIDDSYYDSEGDILLLENFLNDNPSSPPLPPQELKVVEPKNKKSSIDEPPEVELKNLPPHLEYTFLEGTDKLPVIIAKDLKD